MHRNITGKGNALVKEVHQCSEWLLEEFAQ